MQDVFIVRFIIEYLQKTNPPIKWRLDETSGKFIGRLYNKDEAIGLVLGRIEYRGIISYALDVSTESEGLISIEASQTADRFFQKHKDENSRELVESLASLFKVIAEQYLQKKKIDSENEEERRQAIYKKIISI